MGDFLPLHGRCRETEVPELIRDRCDGGDHHDQAKMLGENKSRQYRGGSNPQGEIDGARRPRKRCGPHGLRTKVIAKLFSAGETSKCVCFTHADSANSLLALVGQSSATTSSRGNRSKTSFSGRPHSRGDHVPGPVLRVVLEGTLGHLCRFRLVKDYLDTCIGE